MVKEFKEYDKKYRAFKGQMLSGEPASTARDSWPYMDCLYKASAAGIRNAVYFAEGAEDWQKFRVSLKGMRTVVKLGRLVGRWERAMTMSHKLQTLEMIRINNYIDSMKRSGLLDMDGKVIKHG